MIDNYPSRSLVGLYFCRCSEVNNLYPSVINLIRSFKRKYAGEVLSEVPWLLSGSTEVVLAKVGRGKPPVDALPNPESTPGRPSESHKFHTSKSSVHPLISWFWLLIAVPRDGVRLSVEGGDGPDSVQHLVGDTSGHGMLHLLARCRPSRQLSKQKNTEMKS